MATTKGFIVITSIFDPTEAITGYSAFADYKLVVAGDRKTPSDWFSHNVDFLSISNQKQIGKSLFRVLPLNHYCRKMMGYLYAMERGATYIIDTDDDNIPKKNWGFPGLEGSFCSLAGDQGFVNIYQLYTEERIWPRGMPLNLISQQFNLEASIQTRACRVGIWQGLADGDPDVDAIYRLTNDKPCYFKPRKPVVLGKKTISPFNSQNTLFRKELFALLYLPAHVTFRFTDILRGLVAQPIMWSQDYLLGFTEATVLQKRNIHNYYSDFISEIPVYKHSNEIIEITACAIRPGDSISDSLMNAYEALYNKGIVKKIELKVLNAWLKDIQYITSREGHSARHDQIKSPYSSLHLDNFTG